MLIKYFVAGSLAFMASMASSTACVARSDVPSGRILTPMT